MALFAVPKPNRIHPMVEDAQFRRTRWGVPMSFDQTAQVLYWLSPFITLGGAFAGWLFAQRSKQEKVRRKQDASDRQIRQTQDKEDREALQQEFRNFQDVNKELDRQLGEITPKLATIRKEYAEAVEQIIVLCDRLRATTETATQVRMNLMRAIQIQRMHIKELRLKLTAVGVTVPPEPDIDGLLIVVPLAPNGVTHADTPEEPEQSGSGEGPSPEV